MATPLDPNFLWMEYLIYIADESQAELLQSEFPSGINISPREASTTYSAPIAGLDTGGGALPEPPYISLVGGTASSSLLAIDVETVDYPAGVVIDSFGIPFTAIPSTGFNGGTMAWKGYFLYAPKTPTVLTGNITQIRMQEGFELEDNEVSSGFAEWGSFDSSRVVGHRGWALRDSVGGTGVQYTPPVSTYSSQWTQFYIRPRVLTGQAEIYRTQGRTSSSTLLMLDIDASGNFLVYHNPGGVRTFLGSAGSITSNVWSRIDIFEDWDTVNDVGTHLGGTWDIYINKGLVGHFQSSTANTDAFMLSSILGRVSPNAPSAGLAIDFDDFTIRAFPTGDVSLLLDWINGTHLVPVRGKTATANTSPNWTGTTGPFDSLRSFKSNVGMSCATSSSLIEIQVSDYNKEDVQLGVVGVCLGVNNISGTVGTNGQFQYIPRYDVAGVSTDAFFSSPATFTTPANSAASIQFTDVLLVATTPIQPESIVINYNPGTLGGTITITTINGTLACLGSFGVVDNASARPVNFDPHQSVYPRLPYVNAIGVSPPGIVAVEQGTYVGNGTITELSFRHSPTFIYICSTGHEPTLWCSSMITGRHASDHVVDADLIGRVNTEFDPVTRDVTGFTVRIPGSDASSNQNGLTYKYIAFIDPGGRFNRNTIVIQPDNNLASLTTTPLSDFQFTPLSAFLFYSTNGVAGLGTTYYKGPGHANENASHFVGAEAASVMALSQGGLSLDTNAYTDSQDRTISGCLWRKDDGLYNGACDMVSYVGDGGASKVIAVDLNGTVPSLAFVVPHNGTGSYHKNSSMSGTTSNAIGGGNSTTSITALGTDSITVGLNLNTAGVTYDVFVLSGDSNSIYYPVPTTASPVGPYVTTDPNGWWLSTNGFTGDVQVIPSTERPFAPRDWTKLANWATGGPSYLGGFPAASAVYNNHIIYPGNSYTLGTDQPPLRIFDGLTDRELITVPPTSTGAIPKAILSMLRNGDTIYLTTYDSGTSAADFAGRVFTYDVLSNTLNPLGSGFSGGNMPYAMCWHMGRLWLGTNKGNGTAGKIYFIRPGIDADWTQDHDLATDTVGGAVSLCSYKGRLFVGTDNAAAAFAKVLVRDTLGAYTTSLTATGGTARVNNGFTYLITSNDAVDNEYLVAGYWNPDTTPVAKVYKFDNTTWTTAYTASAAGTLRPYILMFKAVDFLYILGGAKDRSAFMMRTDFLNDFTNLTAFLYGPITETIIPTYGIV